MVNRREDEEMWRVVKWGHQIDDCLLSPVAGDVAGGRRRWSGVGVPLFPHHDIWHSQGMQSDLYMYRYVYIYILKDTYIFIYTYMYIS